MVLKQSNQQAVASISQLRRHTVNGVACIYQLTPCQLNVTTLWCLWRIENEISA